jgi:1,4-dihydroxy-2-naphthoyl-CoA hydrolase
MYKFQTKIFFFDADPAGILFFGRVFEICHRGYEDFIGSLNLNQNYFTHPDIAMPVIHTEADYFKPMKYGDAVNVFVSVEKIKNSSFEIKYALKNDLDEKFAVIKTAHVFIDKKSFSKIDIPEEFKEKLLAAE